MSYPRFQLSRNFKALRRTAGDLTFTQSTTWVKANAAFELPLAGRVGDYLECSFNAMGSNEAQNLFLDVLTLGGAGGSAVTFWGSGGTTANEGVEGWVYETSVYKRLGANVIVGPLTSSDVISGIVYATLGYRTNSSGPSKTVLANANNPLFWSVKNLGPQDPN